MLGRFAATLLGMLAGTGGGMMRDVLVREIPLHYAPNFMRPRP
jgi:uncharacterized membrane protein YeiH